MVRLELTTLVVIAVLLTEYPTSSHFGCSAFDRVPQLHKTNLSLHHMSDTSSDESRLVPPNSESPPHESESRRLAHICLLAANAGFHWSNDGKRAYFCEDPHKKGVPNPMAFSGSYNAFREMLKTTNFTSCDATLGFRRKFDCEQISDARDIAANARATTTCVVIDGVPDVFTSDEFVKHFIDFVFESQVLNSCTVNKFPSGDNTRLVLSWNSISGGEAASMWWGSFVAERLHGRRWGSVVITARSIQSRPGGRPQSKCPA